MTDAGDRPYDVDDSLYGGRRPGGQSQPRQSAPEPKAEQGPYEAMADDVPFRLPRRRHNKLAWNRARRLFRLQRELGWSIADIEDIPFEAWCDRRAMRRGYLYRKLKDFEQ